MIKSKRARRESSRPSSLVPIFVRSTALLILGTFLSACAQSTPYHSPSSHKTILVLIAKSDPVGSFDGLEETLDKSFALLPGTHPHYQRIQSLGALRQSIQETARASGPLAGMILAFHGQPSKLQVAPGETIHQRNVRKLFSGLSGCFHPMASIILYACLTGQDEDNLSTDLAAVFSSGRSPHQRTTGSCRPPCHSEVARLN